MIKNPPAKQETWLWYLGWEDPLEKKTATQPVFWPLKSHGQRSLVGYSPWGHRAAHVWATKHTHTHTHFCLSRTQTAPPSSAQEMQTQPQPAPGGGRGRSTPCLELTSFHLFPGLLVCHSGVGADPQAEGLPEQDAEAPHVTLRAVSPWRADRSQPAQWVSSFGLYMSVSVTCLNLPGTQQLLILFSCLVLLSRRSNTPIKWTVFRLLV